MIPNAQKNARHIIDASCSYLGELPNLEDGDLLRVQYRQLGFIPTLATWKCGFSQLFRESRHALPAKISAKSVFPFQALFRLDPLTGYDGANAGR